MQQLREKIEQKREQLISVAASSHYTSKISLQLSTELDNLLNQYYTMSLRSGRKSSTTH